MTTPPDHAFTVLDNGLRLASERLPGARSVSLGIWIEAGSGHEAPGEEGAAHLWEHLAFKGTARRSALDIAKALDLLGGHSNAFTSREHTCFHARVVDTHLEDALDILADIALSPAPSEDDLAREQDVVLQEIAMVEDDPEDSLMEAFWQAIWSPGSMRHPILGTPETVRSFGLPGLQAWRGAHHVPGRILVAAAGSLDHDRFSQLCAGRFGALGQGGTAPAQAPGDYAPASMLKERDIEQTHVALSFPGLRSTDDRRFALGVLNAILGGTMSSRLFQEVREKRGLAYSVYSFANSLRHDGVLQVLAAVDPERTPELLDCLRTEIAALARGDISAEDLDHARDHLRSVLYLTLESSEDRMSRLARNRLLMDRYVPVEETAARFDAVTLDDVRTLAAQVLDPARAGIGILGPVIDPDWAQAVRA